MNYKLFRFFSPILTSTLFAILNTGTIKDSANNMVTNAWQVSHSTAAGQNCAVLLKVVVNPGDISRNLLAIGQSDTGDFPKSRVRLLGRLGAYNQTNASFLG
jgi:hypothetical protein